MFKYRINLKNSEQANDLKVMLNYAIVKYDSPTSGAKEVKDRWVELFKNIRRQLDVKYVENKRGFFGWFKKKTVRAIDTSALVYTDACSNEWRTLLNAWEPGMVETEWGERHRVNRIKESDIEIAEATRCSEWAAVPFTFKQLSDLRFILNNYADNSYRVVDGYKRQAGNLRHHIDDYMSGKKNNDS